MSNPPPPPPQLPPPFPPPRPSRTAPLLAGGLLGGVDVVVTSVMGLSFGGAGIGVGWLPPAIGLLIPVVLLFSPSTRWWGVGLLIGYFLTLIVLGGACVALLAGFSSGGG